MCKQPLLSLLSTVQDARDIAHVLRSLEAPMHGLHAKLSTMVGVKCTHLSAARGLRSKSLTMEHGAGWCGAGVSI